MIIGISGKKQSGKDTICKIIKTLDIYYRENKVIDETNLSDIILNKIDNNSNISKWEKHAFADSLKSALATILNVDKKLFEDNNFKTTKSFVKKPDGGYYTNRELLQKFGTEVGRNISKDIWVDALFNKYKIETIPEYGVNDNGDRVFLYYNRTEPYWIIPDVRFESEAKAIKDRGGILIRVNRNTGYCDNHPSETALDNYDKFDFIINNKDLKETINTVRNILIEEELL